MVGHVPFTDDDPDCTSTRTEVERRYFLLPTELDPPPLFSPSSSSPSYVAQHPGTPLSCALGGGEKEWKIRALGGIS